jgi:hypothetical protein
VSAGTRAIFVAAQPRENVRENVIFEVLTAMIMPLFVFRVVTSCGFIGGYQRFEGINHKSTKRKGILRFPFQYCGLAPFFNIISSIW